MQGKSILMGILILYILPKISILYKLILNKNFPEMSNSGYRFKFNGLEHKESLSFSLFAPDYCRVSPGLNFLAKCSSYSCEAYLESVYVQKGFGKFNVAK